MNFYKKRSIAIIFVIIVAIIFSLIGVRLSVNRQSQKVENIFYTGADGETGIQTYLDNAFKEAKVIYTTATEYLDSEDTKAFRIAYNELYEADTISEKFNCNETLKAELDALLLLMNDENLLNYDKVYLETHVGKMENIQQMIEKSSYNEKVQEFNENVLGSFPINLLKGILGLDAPEYFVGAVAV